MRILLIAAAIVLWAAGCQSQPQPEPSSDVDTLVEYMVGSFDSAAQAAADTNYFDIRLHMVPIWPDRTDGAWLYVEQAAADQQERPYRQRVYRVTAEADGVFKSAVYTIDDPLRFAGGWHDAMLLADLAYDLIQEREGCAVFLRKQADGTFAGATDAQSCGSVLRGATYATSTVDVSATEIRSWDQGFNAEREQVWGATEGPYIFVKQ